MDSNYVNDVDNLPQTDESSCNTLLYSVVKNNIVPPTTNTKVIITAITVFDVNVRALWSNIRLLLRNILSYNCKQRSFIHCQTLNKIGKPIPPKIINHDNELSNR